MTDHETALRDLLAKGSDATFLREMIGFAAQRLVELTATWQRCKVHWMRNAMAHAGNTQRRIVSAWISTAFAEADAPRAKEHWRSVADQLRSRVPRLAALMDDAQVDMLAYMGFPNSAPAQDPLRQPGEAVQLRD